MLLTALSMILAHTQAAPQAAPPAAGPGDIAYVILADEARRIRIERLFANPRGGLGKYRAAVEGGLYYVSCVTVWRDNPQEREACIRSRLPRRSAGSHIVLNTYERDAPQGQTVVTCIGPGGSGRVTLGTHPIPEDATALGTCLERAGSISAAPAARPYAVRFVDEFEFQDAPQARANAAAVVLVAIDHVGVPRGTTGSCLVQGRVAQAVPGKLEGSLRAIEASIPCGIGPQSSGPRRIRMGELKEGTFARLHLSGNRTLLDYDRMD
jgi:hypothetical protein